MAILSTSVQTGRPGEWNLAPAARFPHTRALAWNGDTLYASGGYELVRTRIQGDKIDWHFVARYRPPWWRNLSSSSRLLSRLCRDGFHALAILPSGYLAAAVPNAIVTLAPGENEFRVTHRVLRGTRPLHIAVTPAGHLFWGEYFSNPGREEVHIYASTDQGATWSVARTFPPGAIRHVHNIVYDRWGKCLWILTGDEGNECRILRASCDLSTIDIVLSGTQQARAVAFVPTADALYFSSDTPLEENFIYRLDRQGKLDRLTPISSSSIYGCAVGESLFFSTMVEPGAVNRDRSVRIYGSHNRLDWQSILHWKKDPWSLKLFQFGNAALPDGVNTSGMLAASTIATESGDMETGLWQIS